MEGFLCEMNPRSREHEVVGGGGCHCRAKLESEPVGKLGGLGRVEEAVKRPDH